MIVTGDYRQGIKEIEIQIIYCLAAKTLFSGIYICSI